MNISTKDFLDFATYNGTCDGISLFNYPAIEKSLKEEAIYWPKAGEQCPFYLEYSGEHCILWTMNGWINECKRRKDEGELFEKINKKMKEAKPIIVRGDIELQIREAIMRGDMNEVLRLKGMME